MAERGEAGKNKPLGWVIKSSPYKVLQEQTGSYVTWRALEKLSSVFKGSDTLRVMKESAKKKAGVK